MYIKPAEMMLMIQGDRELKDVQADFSSAYPYLKIEFFRNGEVRKKRYPQSQKLAGELRIRDAWVRRKKEGELQIDDQMSVAELENALLDQFGLSVQVFRHSGNIWLETTMTDNWSLERQNEHGRELSAPGRTAPPGA